MEANNSKGQVGLILIMVMAAVSAVSLSLASRSVTGLKTAETDVDSLKAFRAAEAGLEKALSEGLDVSGNINDDLKYQVKFLSATTAEGGYITESSVSPGVTLGVVTAGKAGKLRILWSDSSRAALKVSLYSYDSATGGYSVVYYAFDGDTGRGNGFSSSSGSLSFEGIDFADYVDLDLTEKDVLVRVMPLYEETKIGVSPLNGMPLPLQQFKVVSTGKEVSTGVSRKIEFTKSGDALPSMFDHALFTTGALNQ